MQNEKVIIDKGVCTACGECIADCPGHVLAADSQGKAYVENPPRCIQCGHCAAICPVDAVTLPAYNMDNFLPVTKGQDIGYEQLLSFLRNRRSVRRYTDAPIPKVTVDKLLEAARYAPTGSNAQACLFTVINGKAAVREIAKVQVAYFKGLLGKLDNPLQRQLVRMVIGAKAFSALHNYAPFFRQMIETFESGGDPVFYRAPLLIGVSGPKGSYTAYDDSVLHCYHMVLAAETLGLASCLNGFLTGTARHSAEIRAAMQLPDGFVLYSAAGFGYPAVKYHRTTDRFPLRIKMKEGGTNE